MITARINRVNVALQVLNLLLCVCYVDTAIRAKIASEHLPYLFDFSEKLNI
jgi:hypothetical protein